MRLGPPLPEARYTLLGRDGTPDDKVRALLVGPGHRRRRAPRSTRSTRSSGSTSPSAHARLDYARDRDQLLALVRLQQTERLDTWPLVLVRHAHAVARGDWRRPTTPPRPLDALGRDARGRAERRCSPPTASPGSSARPPSAACAPSSRTPSPPGVRLRTQRGPVRGGLRGRPREGPPPPRTAARARRAVRCCAPTGRCSPRCSTTSAARLDLDAAGSVEVVEEFAAGPRREARQGRGPGLPRRRHR